LKQQLETISLCELMTVAHRDCLFALLFTYLLTVHVSQANFSKG